MKNAWSVLLIAQADTQKQLQVGEIERSFGCEILAVEELDVLAIQHNQFHLILIELTSENYLPVLSVFENLAQPFNYENLILFQRLPVTLSIDPFWVFGLTLFLPIGNSFEVIHHALDRHFAAQSQVRSLNQQLNEASDIAILSMSASSQLGEIIRFLEQSYQCRSYEELGVLLNLTLERLGVAGCGLIETDQDLMYFGAGDKQDPWRRLMVEMRSKGRFVDIENRTITNFDSISVMARNMPEVGSEPYGRMKDMLFTLVEGAEARVETLALERAVSLAERAKSTFLRVMSHELRTPMNAILGFSTRLMALPVGVTLKEREHSALGMIYENAERLMEMIEDLEDVSNIHVDTEHARSRVLVEDVLAETLRMTETKAKSKGLNFIVRYAETGLQAEIDPARLVQVMKKLCLNSVKYTHSGEIKINIEASYSRENGEELVIVVDDTGQGIPPDRIKDFFQPFSRFNEDYTHHKQGTGLGLAVVKEFVSDMGGRVELDSVVGRGTRFVIRIPQFITHDETDDVELF